MSDMNSPNALMALSDAMAAAVARAALYTVLVDGRQRMSASGIVVNEGQVLTASHVVERDDDLAIILADGTRLGAELAGRDPSSDLALLKVQAAGLTVASPARPPAQVGQIALAVGRPSPEGVQASLGVVSAVAGPAHSGHGMRLEKYLRTDAIPYPGFSGGPLVNASGDVLGVNTSGLAHGASLAIPAELAWQIAQNLAEFGGIKRGYLGVRSQLVEISPAMQQALGRSQENGLLLVGIEPASPAESGGLMVGDILVGFGGEPVADHDELVSRLIGGLVGNSVPVEVLRGGQRAMLNVTVGEMIQEDRPRRGWRHRR